MKMEYMGMEFEMSKMFGDGYLKAGDMKGAIEETETCINIAAYKNNILEKDFHEIAYKSYVKLAKTFHQKQNSDGARYSLEYALQHHNLLTNKDSPRKGLVQDLLDYIEDKRKEFPLN